MASVFRSSRAPKPALSWRLSPGRHHIQWRHTGQSARNGDAGQHNRYFDYFAARARMLLSIAAAPRPTMAWSVPTPFTFSTPGNNTFNPNSINGSLPVASQQLLDTPGGGNVTIQYLFLQFAGFTFGQSALPTRRLGRATPDIMDFLLGGQNTDTGVQNIQYTAGTPARLGQHRSRRSGRVGPYCRRQSVDGAERHLEHGQRLCRRPCA